MAGTPTARHHPIMPPRNSVLPARTRPRRIRQPTRRAPTPAVARTPDHDPSHAIHRNLPESLDNRLLTLVRRGCGIRLRRRDRRTDQLDLTRCALLPNVLGLDRICRIERVERPHTYALTGMFTRDLEADRVPQG